MSTDCYFQTLMDKLSINPKLWLAHIGTWLARVGPSTLTFLYSGLLVGVLKSGRGWGPPERSCFLPPLRFGVRGIPPWMPTAAEHVGWGKALEAVYTTIV